MKCVKPFNNNTSTEMCQSSPLINHHEDIAFLESVNSLLPVEGESRAVQSCMVQLALLPSLDRVTHECTAKIIK